MELARNIQNGYLKTLTKDALKGLGFGVITSAISAGLCAGINAVGGHATPHYVENVTGFSAAGFVFNHAKTLYGRYKRKK